MMTGFWGKKQKKIKTVLDICRWKRGIFSSKVETRRGIVCPLSILFQAIPGFNAIWILRVSKALSNLTSLTILVTLKPLRWFYPKLRVTKLRVSFVLLDNFFLGLFTEVQIWYWKTFKFDLWQFLEIKSNFQSKYNCF